MASSTPTNNFHSQTARKNITITTDNTTDSQTDRLDRHPFFSCFTEEQQQQQKESRVTHPPHTHISTQRAGGCPKHHNKMSYTTTQRKKSLNSQPDGHNNNSFTLLHTSQTNTPTQTNPHRDTQRYPRAAQYKKKKKEKTCIHIHTYQ